MDYVEQVKAEKIARVRALEFAATAIAAALGNGWRLKSVDEWGHCVEFVDDKGHQIHINNGTRNKGRYTISGGYPRDEHGSSIDYARSAAGYNVELPQITLDSTRSPEAIAKDIARRFLPAYLELYDKAKGEQAKAHGYYAAVQAMAKRLHAAAPGSRLCGDKLDKVDLYRNTGGYFDAECYEDRVNLKLHGVPPDKAEAIIRLLMVD